MALTLFISDLHLDETRPQITELFLQFLRTQAREAQTLYILGDLFEAWLGDDDDSALGSTVCDALRALSEHGVTIRVMHGNRDFLLGNEFSRRSGAMLLPEIYCTELLGSNVLIMHGDQLCTDDTDYQKLRAQLRSPLWQVAWTAKSLEERKAYARHLRSQSEQAKQDKDMAIMDVSSDAVAETMRQHGVHKLIHGHTHRPAMHRFVLDGREAERIVLGDWYQQGSVLRVSEHGTQLDTLALSEHGS